MPPFDNIYIKEIYQDLDECRINAEIRCPHIVDLKDLPRVLNNLNRDPYTYFETPKIEDFIDHIYADPEKGMVVVKWTDGEVTKVHTDDKDNWDLEAGVNAAIVKRLYRSHHFYQNFIARNTTYIQPKKKKKSK